MALNPWKKTVMPHGIDLSTGLERGVTRVTDGSACLVQDAPHADEGGRAQGLGASAAVRIMGLWVMGALKHRHAVLGDRLFNYLTAAMAVLALWVAISA
jgi:hypothetical protein